jgi:hypothetical protein
MNVWTTWKIVWGLEWNDQGLVSMQLGDVKFLWSLNSMKTKTIFHASKQQYF